MRINYPKNKNNAWLFSLSLSFFFFWWKVDPEDLSWVTFFCVFRKQNRRDTDSKAAVSDAREN